MGMMFFAALIVFALFVFTLRKEPAERVVVAMVVVSISLLPRTVMSPVGLDSAHVGIAQSAIVLMTYHVAAIIALAFYAVRKPGLLKMPIAYTVFIPALVFCVAFVWTGSAAEWAGVWHFAIAVTFWPIGVAFFAFLESKEKNQIFFVRLLLAVLLVQLGLSVLQILGLPLPVQVTGGSDATLVGTERVIGSLGNPANLSKISYFLMLLVLPLATVRSTRVRRLAFATIIIAVLVATLTISRANVAATFATLGIWLLLTPGRISIGQRFLVLTGAGAVFYTTGGSTIERFLVDPEGSIRPELTAIAMEQLGLTFWTGVGINSYVAQVGQTHALVAAGYPVHNSFLLMLAEAGPLLAALFFAPLVLLVFKAFTGFWSPRTRNAGVVATLSAVPGIGVILWTGYGTLGTFLLPVLLLSCGACWAWIYQSSDAVEYKRSDAAPHRQHQRV